jgi:hypothetical protein
MCTKTWATLGCLAVFAGALLADDYNKRTIVTFHEPVMVAGVPVVTLEPGTYVIKLMNQSHTRNIVQVFNEREDHLYTTVLAIPNYRLFPKEHTSFSFWETPTGNPMALRAWFFPGDNWGQEFVYPKGLAAKIAAETGQPVLTTPAETEAELAAAPVTEVTKEGVEQPVEEAAAAPEPVAEVAEAAPAPEPAPAEVAAAPEPAAATEEIPATASPFYAIGLFGILAIAAGFALRRLGFAKS